MRRFAIGLLLCGIASALYFSGVATATPLLFRRTRGILLLNFEAFDPVGGRYGEVADWGLGLSAEASLQSGYFGGAIRMGLGRGLTKNEGIPYNAGYSMRYIAAGPRFLVPILRRYMMAIYVQPEFALRMPYSDTLVLYDGAQRYLGSVGGGAGVQFFLGALLLNGGMDVHWSWDLDSVFIVLRVGVGLGANF